MGPQGSGWFHVAPSLRAGVGGAELLPLDGVMCQTVLAKCLGPLPRWEPVLRVAHEAGYNMIHFTPVQELGASRSSYSIANQLRLNPAFSADGGREATFADVENIVSKMRTDWKVRRFHMTLIIYMDLIIKILSIYDVTKNASGAFNRL